LSAQQPGTRALIGRNLLQKPEKRLIGRRLFEVDVRAVGAAHDPFGAASTRDCAKGTAVCKAPCFASRSAPLSFTQQRGLLTSSSRARKGARGLDRGQWRLEGRRRGEGKLVEGPVDVGMTVAVPTNSMLAGQECDVLRAKRCFCSFDGFEKIGDRLWPNVRKDRERLAEQIAQHDRPNT
jgi:hypothetical protein